MSFSRRVPASQSKSGGFPNEVRNGYGRRRSSAFMRLNGAPYQHTCLLRQLRGTWLPQHAATFGCTTRSGGSRSRGVRTLSGDWTLETLPAGIATDSKASTEDFGDLGTVITSQGLNTCIAREVSWKIESARWHFLKFASAMGQGGTLVQFIHAEYERQKEVEEKRGHRTFTWAVLRAAQALLSIGSPRVQGAVCSVGTLALYVGDLSGSAKTKHGCAVGSLANPIPKYPKAYSQMP